MQMLDDHFQPFIEKKYPTGYVFQQDNAPAKTGAHTKEYFMEEGEMVVVDWPSCSSDLNPVENAWGTVLDKKDRPTCLV